MSVMKRRTLLALVAVAFVLFGLTLNSCKDCNSGRNRGKGKDPSGGGSPADNLAKGKDPSGGGSPADNLAKGKDPSGGGSPADNLANGSPADNLAKGKDPSGGGSPADNLADKNNPATPPKERGALTPEEKRVKLNKLKAELVAAAEVVIMDGEDDAHKSPIVKIKDDITYNYRNLRTNGNYDTATYEEKWFYHLYMMCLYQKDWATYLKEKCNSDKTPENDNEDGDERNAKKQKDLAEDMEEKGRVAAAKRKDDIWNKLEPLLEPAKQDWENLLAAEEAYRNALRGKFKP